MFQRLFGRSQTAEAALTEIDLDVDESTDGGNDDPSSSNSQAAAASDHAEPILPHDVALDMAKRVLAQVEAEEIQLGRKYTDKERMLLLELRSTQAAMDWLKERQEGHRHAQLMDEIYQLRRAAERLPAQLDNHTESATIPTLLNVWRKHPFLVGWFGADLVRQMKRR